VLVVFIGVGMDLYDGIKEKKSEPHHEKKLDKDQEKVELMNSSSPDVSAKV